MSDEGTAYRDRRRRGRYAFISELYTLLRLLKALAESVFMLEDVDVEVKMRVSFTGGFFLFFFFFFLFFFLKTLYQREKIILCQNTLPLLA